MPLLGVLPDTPWGHFPSASLGHTVLHLLGFDSSVSCCSLIKASLAANSACDIPETCGDCSGIISGVAILVEVVVVGAVVGGADSGLTELSGAGKGLLATRQPLQSHTVPKGSEEEERILSIRAVMSSQSWDP